MTPTPTHLQALEAKIREAVPESMELKFGCLCQNNWSDSHEPYIFIRKSGTDTVFWSEQFKKEIRSPKKRKDDDREPYKILGRPLNLQDVLIALMEIPLGINMDTTGKLYMTNCSCIHGTGREKAVFDLQKDFHNQSDELKAFLHSLLIEK